MNKQEDKKSIDAKYIGWILFLIVLFFLIGMIVGPRLVKGLNTWPLDKNATCSLPSINKTGIDCDAFWCEKILDMRYDINNTLCIKEINNTNFTSNVTNSTTNVTVNSTNSTNMTLFNFTGNISNMTIQQYIDFNDMAIRDGLLNRIENLTTMLLQRTGNYSYSSNYVEAEPWPWYAYVIIVAIIGGVLIYIVTTSLKIKEKVTKALPYRKIFDNSKFVNINPKEDVKESKIDDETKE